MGAVQPELRGEAFNRIAGASYGAVLIKPIPGSLVIGIIVATTLLAASGTVISKDAYQLERFESGTRVLVLKQQGSWSRIKMEDKVVGWFYNAKFKWLE